MPGSQNLQADKLTRYTESYAQLKGGKNARSSFSVFLPILHSNYEMNDITLTGTTLSVYSSSCGCEAVDHKYTTHRSINA